MNSYNNYAMPGLNGDGDDFFDFEAASSNTLWTGTNNSLAQQAQTFQADEVIHVMPLTKSEIEAILAVRASNAQNRHHSYGLTPPELNTNFSGLEEPGVNYDGAEIPIPTNFCDFNMPEYGKAPPNALDGFEQPQFEEPAEVFEALTDCAPNAADQSGHTMKQAVDNNVSKMVAFSPIQTGESIRQPEHLESALQLWSVGGKCTWPECTSRAVFKTKASFNMHVTNVHTNPLLCLVPNCPHKTPFGRLSDLRRHEQSAHSLERRFVCTVSSCDASIKEFARKDHLTKHMRERHDNYFCPINHCPRSTKSSFASPEGVLEHIKVEHELYECALKACAQAPSSKFSSDSLINHLRNHHGMSVDTTFHSVGRTDKRLSKTVIEADLGRGYCGECKTCEKRHYVTKE